MEGTPIHFLWDVFTAMAIVVSWLKIPNTSNMHVLLL